MRICSHLEAQLACHQVDDVFGVRVFSHLEVINTNRTTCTEANGSQVCEYARTWKRNPLAIKWMMFYVCEYVRTWKRNSLVIKLMMF